MSAAQPQRKSGILPDSAGSLPACRFTLTLEALTSDALTAAMVAHLEEQGYGITAPNEAWETPAEFLARLGLRKHETLTTSLALWERRGHSIRVSRGPRRRILELLSNPAFDAFCRRNKR